MQASLNMTKVTLVLEDGCEYEGISFGESKSISGEVGTYFFSCRTATLDFFFRSG